MTMAESRDHPDWWRPVGGSNATDSVLERRSLISNNGDVPLWEDGSVIVARGKFFTRGMRGFLETIEIYCQDPLAAGGTIYVHISPFPESGTAYTVNIVVPPGGGPAWRAATFNLFWNYDSMFIWWYSALLGTEQFAYDEELPWDAYFGSPTGIIWITADRRYWVRVLMAGETPGDVPVSGTLNTVVLPNLTANMDATSIAVDGPGEEDIIPDVFTMGKLTCLIMTLAQTLGVVPPANMEIHIHADQTVHTLTVAEIIAAVEGVVNTVGPISMGIITPATNTYQVSFNVEFPFRQRLSVRVENTALAGNNIVVDAMYVYEIIG